jgi:hypothetical protein
MMTRQGLKRLIGRAFAAGVSAGAVVCFFGLHQYMMAAVSGLLVLLLLCRLFPRRPSADATPSEDAYEGRSPPLC